MIIAVCVLPEFLIVSFLSIYCFNTLTTETNSYSSQQKLFKALEIKTFGIYFLF